MSEYSALYTPKVQFSTPQTIASAATAVLLSGLTVPGYHTYVLDLLLAVNQGSSEGTATATLLGRGLVGFAVGEAVPAEGSYTLTAAPADGDQVVSGAQTYTFKTVLGSTAGNVLIGGSATAAISNLVAAVNGSAGAGVAYVATSTSPNAGSFAVVNSITPNQAKFTALLGGTAGNSLAATTTSSVGSWGSGVTTLLGGVAATAPTALTTGQVCGTGTNPNTITNHFHFQVTNPTAVSIPLSLSITASGGNAIHLPSGSLRAIPIGGPSFRDSGSGVS